MTKKIVELALIDVDVERNIMEVIAELFECYEKGYRYPYFWDEWGGDIVENQVFLLKNPEKGNARFFSELLSSIYEFSTNWGFDFFDLDDTYKELESIEDTDLEYIEALKQRKWKLIEVSTSTKNRYLIFFEIEIEED